ncbi:hypothetical protein [Arthrobacter sp. Soil736]|uniref:hypothetical protein n=1 Tax=Arthrobacter sp. Soil736 TaxID=1736395 RepID=UPI0012F82674|nr:hypothetical protein [Arthrobacter sp. Soil736]
MDPKIRFRFPHPTGLVYEEDQLEQIAEWGGAPDLGDVRRLLLGRVLQAPVRRAHPSLSRKRNGKAGPAPFIGTSGQAADVWTTN